MIYPLSIYRGDTARWAFTLTDGLGAPSDLTGVTVAATIGTTALTCSVAANVITVTLPASASQTLALTPARWDLQLTYPSGDVQTIVSGPVQVRADVTGAVA